MCVCLCVCPCACVHVRVGGVCVCSSRLWSRAYFCVVTPPPSASSLCGCRPQSAKAKSAPKDMPSEEEEEEEGDKKAAKRKAAGAKGARAKPARVCVRVCVWAGWGVSSCAWVLFFVCVCMCHHSWQCCVPLHPWLVTCVSCLFVCVLQKAAARKPATSEEEEDEEEEQEGSGWVVAAESEEEAPPAKRGRGRAGKQ